MAKETFSVVAGLDGEKLHPANCVEIGRFGGLKEGIALSLDRGHEPAIWIGERYVARDRFRGALFARSADGTYGVMRRARLNEVQRDGKPPRHTLAYPGDEKLNFSIVRVSYPLAQGARVAVNGWDLRIHAGVRTTGQMFIWSSEGALVVLRDGEECICFFPDGAVRLCQQNGTQLEERTLSLGETLDLRIEDAFVRLIEANGVLDDERRTKVIRAILYGMADLLHLTSLFGSEGQVMRLTLMREFFFAIEPEYLGFVQKKIEAILHQVDRPLIAMFYEGRSAFVLKKEVSEKTNVTDLASERAKRDAARRARQLERLAQAPKKGPGGGGKQKNSSSNPERMAKRARKEAQRKK